MTPTIDITAEQRRTILALLDRHLPDTAAWACGSRVKGGSRPASDLDLVVFARPEQSAQVAELREAFEESDLPFRVDLFVWDETPESFRKRIESKYGVLVEINHDDSGCGWRETTLGDVVELKRGYDLPQQERKYGEIPIVSSSGVTAYHSQSKVRGPGVVTGRYGTLGQVFFIINDFWPLNTTLYVRDFKGNDPRFVSCLLKVLDFSAYSDKAAVPGLNRNHLHQASVRIPENIAEQRDIAHILGTLDDKIELNRRMNETLEAAARVIFKDWFIDFGPTRAKIEGRKPYLPERLWSLFPDKLLDATGLPKNWKSSTLEDYMTLAYGKSLPAKTRRPGQVAVYGSGGFVDFHDEALVNGPTVIVGRKGTVGSVYYEDRSAFPIDTVFYVIPKRSTHLFCYQILLTQPLCDMNTDAAVPGLNRANVYRLEFPWPGSELSDAYHELISPIWKRRSVILKEIEILNHIRDVLLLNLVSGKIRISRISEENYDVE